MSPVDDFGDTPLHLAVENRHFDLCDYIIRNIFDINPRYHDRDTTMDHSQLHSSFLDNFFHSIFNNL